METKNKIYNVSSKRCIGVGIGTRRKFGHFVKIARNLTEQEYLLFMDNLKYKAVFNTAYDEKVIKTKNSIWSIPVARYIVTH